MSDHYVVVSLPFSQGADQQPTNQFQHLQRQMGDLGAALRHFIIPPLKVGTLDSLMEASDELAKLDPTFESTVSKLVSLLEEASQRPRSAICSLRINQSQELTCDAYLKHFGWNVAQFDTKEPIRVLVERLTQVVNGSEERIRGVVNEYSETRNKVQNAMRKSQGNYASRSINDAVRQWCRAQKQQVLSTEFLQTIFVAVANSSSKEFRESYWHMHDFVCPRSASIVAEDKEFVLYSVVVFKKAVDDFKMGCRKRKFMVRDLDADDGDSQQLDQLQSQLDQQKSSLVQLLTHQFSLCYVAWIHVKALRIFVESMLKYGLPPKFVPILLAVDASKEHAIRKQLGKLYPDLSTPLGDDNSHFDSGALQQEHPYVSLKIANISH